MPALLHICAIIGLIVSLITASLKMDPRFYLCSRGVVINLEHAVDFDGALFILDDETRISVSRKLVKNARQTFMDFLFQRGH